MIRAFSATEYRLVVPGPAISFRSKHAVTYKNLIKELTLPVFRKPITRRAVELRLNYFHMRPRKMDMDNVAKCVLDALT